MIMSRRFRNREEAGRQLAERLAAYGGREDALILALPRGGVPVAYEVARSLGLPLDVYLVRKLGVPGQEELAMGAISSGGICVLNEDVVRGLDIPPEVISAVAAMEMKELARREVVYRGDRPFPSIERKTVILIDDGIATGSTVRAAIESLRRQRPARVVVAVPVAPPSTCFEIRQEVDEMVCLLVPEAFEGVGRWYEDFSQTSDDEVRTLLACARASNQLHD
jgi:predicted phosphoribosyltransferase